MPELKKTGCKIWGFILPEVSDIEGEIDLWTAEIEKNFKVIRAESYEAVLDEIQRMKNEYFPSENILLGESYECT